VPADGSSFQVEGNCGHEHYFMRTGLAEYTYFSQTVELGQATEYRLHCTLPKLFHPFALFTVLSAVSPQILLVIDRSGDFFGFCIWRTLGFHETGLAVLRCRPIAFQYATVPVGTESLEGQGPVHRATVFVLFLVVGKTFYLRFIFPENGYPSGNFPLFEKIVVGAIGITCVRQEICHYELVSP
jgi:hypothetical protein